MRAFGQVDRGRYSDQVIQNIKREIFTHRLAVGDKLPGEKELTEQFGVSRTVVREAIRALEESGLVEIKKGPKGGVFVTHVFHKPVSKSLKGLLDHGEVTVDHLFDVRLVIEPHIAAEAAMRATADDLHPLKALMAESALHQDDVQLLQRNNISFHLLLAKAARNPVLTILMESVTQLLEEFSADLGDLAFGRQHSAVHTELLALIEQQNADGAREMITDDITKVRNRLNLFIEKRSDRLLTVKQMRPATASGKRA
jgi:DNA-binding FadR family transcriptional regulator